MERVTEILPAGAWPRAVAEDVVRLAYDDRLRRRKCHVGASGRAFLLDLPDVRLLADGDGLRLASGTVIAVEALPEALLEVAGDPALLARVAWHLGNRHVAVEVGRGTLRLREDKVTADLLARLGVCAVPLSAPFNPEGGAHGALGHDRAPTHTHPYPHIRGVPG